MELRYREFLIRAWQPSDRQAVSDIVQTVLAEYGMGFEPEQTDRDAVYVEEAYWQTGGEFWVIEHHVGVIGSGGYYPSSQNSKAVELRKMFILPEYRRKGLGRFMLGELEKAIFAKGFTEIHLETATVLSEAIRLYERCGYRPSPGPRTQRCDRAYFKTLPLFKV